MNELENNGLSGLIVDGINREWELISFFNDSESSQYSQKSVQQQAHTSTLRPECNESGCFVSFLIYRFMPTRL